MNRAHEAFPNRVQLWRGVVLATIAHAIGMAADPLLSYELSWDGPNYSRQDSQGTRGTLTFTPVAVVAVFRDDNSPRAPWNMDGEYHLETYFRGIPEDLMLLAYSETLQYMLEEYGGETSPIVTAAFWLQKDIVPAAEPWAAVFEHGAHLIGIELGESEAAISEWTEYHDMSPAQSDLLRTLYARRIQERDQTILLDTHEYAVLTSEGVAGIEESRQLLAAIDITLPK